MTPMPAPPPPPPVTLPRPTTPVIAAPINGPPPAGSANVSVYYATDRQKSAGTVLAYDNARNQTGRLELGRFDVSVPRDHERGELERPSLWTFWREDPEKHFTITGRTRLTYGGFYDELRDRISRFSRKDAFVFVHGFNVSFEDAVFRTAQFAYDLQVPIAPILYSWPSAASLNPTAYIADTDSSAWTERHLRWFLEDVLMKTGAERVHLVAHSMGNKALVNALAAMPPVRSRRFGQIVLTAPDMDADTFVELADAIQGKGERTTLYASSRDAALLASKQLRGGIPRAGDTSDRIVVVPGVDTIDVSVLKTDFLGHSPQGSGSVIGDIFLLFTQGLAPGSRPGLREIASGATSFWRFVP